MLDLELAAPGDLPEVAAFYQSVGYSGVARAEDEIHVGREQGRIVGVVRLCEEESVLVLRGMYVAADRRGQGVGPALLAAVSRGIGERACWCVPYSHLERFYSHAGFRTVDASEAPPFLNERAERYRANGQEVVISHRAGR